MFRRSSFLATAVAVALAASAGASAKAALTPTEPDPIVVDKATVERARTVLEAVGAGTFERSELAPKLAASVSVETLKEGASAVSALGAVQSMYPFEKRVSADETSTYFRVRYPNQILTWVFSVDDAGKIVGLSLRAGPNNKVFNVVYRDVQY